MIIPAYNEEKIIRNSVERAHDFLYKSCKSFELIVVDDGSNDSTADILCETDAAVISLSENRGKGAAVRAGVAQASGDYIFFTDADLPYPLDFIITAVSSMQNCDIICGKRKGNYPLLRSAASVVYNGIAQVLLEVNIDDLQCGIKGFTKTAAKRIFSVCRVDGFAFDTEVIFLAGQMGFSVGVSDVDITHRAGSKIRLISNSIEMLRDVLKIKNSFKAGEYNLLQT